MTRRYPYLRAMFPGVLVEVRDAEHEREIRRHDFIGVIVYIGVLMAATGWLAWQVAA